MENELFYLILQTIKDYYQILKVHKNASVDEIKKSYRALAHVYHPDKNQGNDIVSNYFTEIQEAYSVLSNSISKRVYDRERSRLGHSSNATPIQISSEFIQKELDQLIFISNSSKSAFINKELVTAYLKFLLTEQNIAILNSEKNVSVIKNILLQIVEIAKMLDYFYYFQIEPRLKIMANGNKEFLAIIEKMSIEKRRQKLWIKTLPIFIIFITILMCFMMYFYAKN